MTKQRPTVDMNNLSDDELNGMALLYEMQKNQHIADSIAYRQHDSNGYSESVRDWTTVKEEQYRREKGR